MEKMEELLYDLYDNGRLAGQLAMIWTMEDLGVINDKMAELIRSIITGRHTISMHLDEQGAKRSVQKTMEKIEYMG